MNNTALKMRRNNFTLLELLCVIAIIGILAGMMMPSFGRARDRAKFIRWFSYNSQMNRDTDTVINFNFQRMNYGTKVDGEWCSNCLENNAVACDYKGFDSNKYCGVLVNGPEWLRGGGRWPQKNAVQFDGNDGYIYIPTYAAINFTVDDDFTCMMWVNFYGNPKGSIMSKNTSSTVSQYSVSLGSGSLYANIGKDKHTWTGVSASEADRWIHFAMVNVAGEGMNFYINGKKIGSSDSVDDYITYVHTTNYSVAYAAKGGGGKGGGNSGGGNSGGGNGGGNSGGGNSGGGNGGGNSGGGNSGGGNGGGNSGGGNSGGGNSGGGNSGGGNGGGNSGGGNSGGGNSGGGNSGGGNTGGGNTGGGNTGGGNTGGGTGGTNANVVVLDVKTVIGAMGRMNGNVLNPTDTFNGKMDEFIILRRAMSSSEISQAYEAGSPY